MRIQRTFDSAGDRLAFTLFVNALEQAPWNFLWQDKAERSGISRRRVFAASYGTRYLLDLLTIT